MTLVSVVLNSYNQGEYLGAAIESVLAQTYGDFELLVIDNGSTDDSVEVTRRYLGDKRVSLIAHSESVSLSRRQNEGVQRARGELVSFLYSDDYYLPQKLARQVAEMARLPSHYGVVYGPRYRLNMLTGKQWLEGSLDASGYILPAILRRAHNAIEMLPPLSRRECLLRYPFFDDLFAEGEAVYQRIAMKYWFHYSPEPLVVMREHNRNIGKATRRNHEAYLEVLARMAAHPDFPAELVPDLRRYRARMLRNAGWIMARVSDRDMDWARTRFSHAVRADWRQALHPRTVLGLGLTLLPDRLRRRVNALGFALRQNDGSTAYVEEYPGQLQATRQ